MSRNWNPNVAKIVGELEKMPSVMGCSTYPWHGATDTGVNGEPWGIDVQVAPWGNYASKTEEAVGDRVQKWVEANWQRLGIHYMIWWGWITYAPDPDAWQRYNPGSYNNDFASPDPETEMHMDHVHLEIHTNYTYKPPKKDGNGEIKAVAPLHLPQEVSSGKDNPIWGVDVSSHQPRIDMARVKREGYEFCVVKATEGPTFDGWVYTNPYYAEQLSQAKAAGMVVGAYHFLVEGPAKPQVDHFLGTVGNVSDKIVMVDFEEYGNRDYPEYDPTNATLKAFVAELRKRIGQDHPILLYSGQGYWNGGEPSGPVSQYGNLVTWDAYYPQDDRGSTGPDLYKEIKHLGWGERWGGQEPKIWQFSGSVGAAGVEEVDVNAFRGTRAELLALAGIRGAAQTKHPTPTPQTAPPRIKPDLVAVGELDEEAAFAAAKVFRRRDFFVTVTVGRKRVHDFDEEFASDEVGTRQMIVVGSPARDALLPDSHKHIHNPWQPSRSDYIGCVGKDYPGTLRLLEGVLEAHAGKGAGAEFRAVLEARVDAGDHETIPPDEPDEESPSVTPKKRRRGRKRATDGRRRDREDVEVDSEEADGAIPTVASEERRSGRGRGPDGRRRSGGPRRDREEAEERMLTAAALTDGGQQDGDQRKSGAKRPGEPQRDRGEDERGPEEVERQTPSAASSVREALDYALQVVGAPYGSWWSGPVSRGQPTWAEDAPPPDPVRVKRTSCFCAGVTNLMLRAVDKEIPQEGIYSGGTLAYGLYYEDRAEPFDVTKRYPEGTLIGRKFRDAEDPGHVAVVLDNGKLLQSYADDTGESRPGVNTDVTAKDSHGEGLYEYAVLPKDWLE